MRPGAANASSMEHSSGSVFISQYFMMRIVVLEGESPAAVEVSPTYAGAPCLRTLAKQGGRLPVTSGSSGTPEAGTITTMRLGAATRGSHPFGKLKPYRAHQGTPTIYNQISCFAIAAPSCDSKAENRCICSA